MAINRNDLVAGTRPDIGDKIIISAGESFDGYEIVEYKGMAWGLSMRAKDFGQDCAMSCKHFTCGALSSYTALGDESRQKAIDRLFNMARRLKANAIVHFRFDHEQSVQGAALVVAYGTAVVIKPIKNYVPTGAIGNILADMADQQE